MGLEIPTLLQQLPALGRFSVRQVVRIRAPLQLLYDQNAENVVNPAKKAIRQTVHLWLAQYRLVCRTAENNEPRIIPKVRVDVRGDWNND